MEADPCERRPFDVEIDARSWRDWSMTQRADAAVTRTTCGWAGYPDVSFIVPSFARGWDKHPSAGVSVGMGIQEQLITALQESSAWDHAAYVLTYDEHGGFDQATPGDQRGFRRKPNQCPVPPPRDGLAGIGNMLECFAF